MTQIEFESVYKKENKVDHSQQLEPGDKVVYWSSYMQTVVEANVLGVDTYFNIIELDNNTSLNLHISDVYKPKRYLECDCGAKFTSNPRHHLRFCSTLERK